jgi:hypothetical protein
VTILEKTVIQKFRLTSGRRVINLKRKVSMMGMIGLQKTSVLALVLVGATLGLTGCGGNPLLKKDTLAEVRNDMDGYFATSIEARKCASYYTKKSTDPDRKELCTKWTEKVFNELKTRHDSIPDNATIEDFRDPQLWLKINPYNQG